MKIVKKIFNCLFLFSLSSFALSDINSRYIEKIQFVSPQKETMADTKDPGGDIVLLYAFISTGLSSYNHTNQKCSPYFKENDLERQEVNRANKALTDLRVCYKNKTGKSITEQMVREANNGSNTGGFDFNTIKLLEQMDNSGINPRSIKDANICKEKSTGLSLAMIPMRFTEFPSPGWCNKLDSIKK